MTLYAESSAVLAWLFDQGPADEVRATIGSADLVVTSELSLIEAERALLRVVATGLALPEEAMSRRIRLATTMRPWAILPISTSVADRARQPFPFDAIRSLDAIHLASAIIAQVAFGAVDVLTLDDRIRENATALGFRVLPA